MQHEPSIPKSFEVFGSDLYHRILKPVANDYVLCGAPLQRSSRIVDLGVLCDERLTFSSHIEELASRAMRSLGFLKRNTREFTNVDAIVCLYKALVLPKLEYASTVWSPLYAIHKYRLERVHRKFLRYVAYKMGIPSGDINYASLLRRCRLDTLERRRSSSDLVLLFKILNNEINCPPLLSKIHLVASRTAIRSSVLFSIPFSSTNYDRNRPLHRLLRSANLFLVSNPQFDFFHSSLATLKTLTSSSSISFH